jgi:hypothetical protein
VGEAARQRAVRVDLREQEPGRVRRCEHPRLDGDGKLVRTMRFRDIDDLEACRADLEAVVRAWCEWRVGS